MKFKFYLLFHVFIGLSFSAQEGELPVPAKVIIDTLDKSKQDMLPADSLLTIDYTTNNTTYNKSFSPDLSKKYKGKDFNYELIKPKESLWQRIKRNISRLLSKIFGDLDPKSANRYTINFLRLVGVLALSVLLYFLIKYLLSKEGNFFFSKKNSKTQLRSGDIIENIHDINFNEIILKSENDKDFRSAIRYRFLQVLKILSDKDKIKWMPEKTNQDYSAELKDQAQIKQFEELAYIFDYAWYGEFQITETDYQFYKNKFINSKF